MQGLLKNQNPLRYSLSQWLGADKISRKAAIRGCYDP